MRGGLPSARKIGLIGQIVGGIFEMRDNNGTVELVLDTRTERMKARVVTVGFGHGDYPL